MNNDVLTVKNLKIDNVGGTSFDNFNFHIKHGEIVSIIGANKCGKSTLIDILSGNLPTNDFITVNNITLNEKTRTGFLKRIGLVKCDYTDEDIKTKEYIEKNLDKKRDKVFYKKMLELFSIEKLMDIKVNNLSTDDFVKVEFFRNLVKKPNVLFIDYTKLNISSSLKESLVNIYKILVKEDIAIVYATNDSSDLIFSDTTYVIHKGVIAISGKTEDVLQQDGLLLKLGIELPFEVDLSLKLKMYNLVDKIYYDIDELVMQLWK